MRSRAWGRIGRPAGLHAGLRARRALSGFLVAISLVLAPSTAAWAGSCGALRSFNGIVKSASGGSLSVERGGRTTSFKKASGARVVDEGGTGVSGWSKLRPGLRVNVCWAFDDEPRAARIVFVSGR